MIPAIGPPREASFNAILAQLWILITYTAAGFLLYIVYMSSFLHTSYVVTGEDIEALIFHANVRFYAQTMSTGSFVAYSLLMVSLFFNGTILYTLWWPVISSIIIASILTSVVVWYVLKANKLCYSVLPQFSKCDDPTGSIGDLLPEWENALKRHTSTSENDASSAHLSMVASLAPFEVDE